MSKISILIVEDEAIVAVGLDKKLERLGSKIAEIAAKGAKAIKKRPFSPYIREGTLQGCSSPTLISLVLIQIVLWKQPSDTGRSPCPL